MARDGSGDFSRVEGPYVNGNVADADEINAEMDDIADGLSDSINKAGTKAFAANQSMGGFRLTDLATPSSANDAARKAYVDSAITAAAQPLDATLTALAALSWSSGAPVLQFTAADTVSLTLTPSVTSLDLGGTTDTTLTRASAGVVAVEGVSLIRSGETDPTFAGLHISGGNLTAGNLLHAYFNSSVGYLRALENGVAWRDLQIDGNILYLNSNSGGAIVAGGAFASDTLTARVLDSSETGGTLTSLSRNRRVKCGSNPTLPASGMTEGDFIIFDPAGTARTVTRPAAHTMYIRDADSATGTSYAQQAFMAIYNGSSKWTLHGMA